MNTVLGKGLSLVICEGSEQSLGLQSLHVPLCECEESKWKPSDPRGWLFSRNPNRGASISLPPPSPQSILKTRGRPPAQLGALAGAVWGSCCCSKASKANSRLSCTAWHTIFNWVFRGSKSKQESQIWPSSINGISVHPSSTQVRKLFSVFSFHPTHPSHPSSHPPPGYIPRLWPVTHKSSLLLCSLSKPYLVQWAQTASTQLSPVASQDCYQNWFLRSLKTSPLGTPRACRVSAHTSPIPLPTIPLCSVSQ